MSVGTGVEVTFDANVPPTYGEWVTKRANLVPTPDGNWTNYWLSTNSGLTTVATGGPTGGSFIRYGVPSAGAGYHYTTGPMAASTTYMGSMYVRSTVAMEYAINFVPYAGGSNYQGGEVFGPTVMLQPNVWTRLNVVMTSLPNTQNFELRVRAMGAGTLPAHTLDITMALVETGATLNDYFSGNTLDTDTVRQSWASTVNGSTSYQDTRQILSGPGAPTYGEWTASRINLARATMGYAGIGTNFVGTGTIQFGGGPVSTGAANGARDYFRLTKNGSPQTIAGGGDIWLYGQGYWVPGNPVGGTSLVEPNTTYTASVYVRNSFATTMRIQAQSILGAGGGQVPVSGEFGPDTPIPANTWTRLYTTFTTPASNMPAVRIDVDAGAGGVTAPANSTMDISGFMLEKGGLKEFFSAYQGVTETTRAVWQGQSQDSPSILEVRPLLTTNSAARRSISAYSVVEDATPLEPSDFTGGFGQITVDMPLDAESKRLMGKELTMIDGSMGQTVGTVRSLSGDETQASVTASSRLAQIAVERDIQPLTSTLTAGLTYLLSLCGITTGIVIEPWMNSVTAQIPGGRDNIYDYIKRMSSAYDFEMSLVSSNIVFRAPRGRVAVNYRDAGVSWDFSQDHLARSVQGYNYNTFTGGRILYPRPSDTTLDAPVWQIDAGELQVYNVPVNASVASVVQPIIQNFVGVEDTSASKYAVTDSEGVVVESADWVTNGGSIQVEIGEDTQSLNITIQGPNLPERAPFRIGLAHTENTYYSTLRIVGTGVHWNKELVTLVLSDNEDLAPDEVGVVVDNPFLANYDQLYHRLLRTAERYGTDRQTISVTTAGINRLGESGSAMYPTIGDLATLFPGATISSISAELGPTIADWNAELYSYVSSDFENQAFGNVAGARVLHDNCYYRIRSATLRPEGVEYVAERDNVIGDVYRTGELIGEWNTRWAGRTIRDVNITPLLNAP